jgi:hypothetical protein
MDEGCERTVGVHGDGGHGVHGGVGDVLDHHGDAVLPAPPQYTGGARENGAHSEMKRKCESNDSGLARGDRNWPLHDGQTPAYRGVRVALGTCYNTVEGNRRASRNGRVSSSPTRNPCRYDSHFFASLC